jgi:peptidoglycan/LPS O-acetylase OafA/YrhL
MQKDIASLTPMRGIAALIVVLYHVRLAAFAQGYLAVDFFFVLSGFVLLHVYGSEFGVSLHRAGTYLWSRLCRIYPVHALVTLCLVPHLGTAPGFSGSDLVTCLLLSQVMLTHTAFNDLAWSVSAEWYAYLAFPVLTWVVARLDPRGMAIAAVAAAAFWAIADKAGS